MKVTRVAIVVVAVGLWSWLAWLWRLPLWVSVFGAAAVAGFASKIGKE